MLRVEIAPAVGACVGDERRSEQILLNLIGNAVKFTDAGEVSVLADYVPCEAGQQALRVRIRDTGCGIREQDLQTLFQPFRQIDSGLVRKHEGTGLGLAISRHLAAAMGGRIEASSEWGKGSTFTVVLPLNAGSRA